MTRDMALIRIPFGALPFGNQLLNFPHFVYAIPGNSFWRKLSHVSANWQLPTGTNFTPEEASSAYGELALYRFAGAGIPSGSFDPASANQPLAPILGASPTAQLLGHWLVGSQGFALEALDIPSLESNADHAFVLSNFEYRQAAGGRAVISTGIARAFITVLGYDVRVDPVTSQSVPNFITR